MDLFSSKTQFFVCMFSLLCLVFSVNTLAEQQPRFSNSDLLAEQQDIRVAVLAFRGDKRALDRWSSTMTYLNEKLPGYQFRAIPMNLADLDEAVTNSQIDFAITNSGQFVRVGSRFGMSWLATLKSRRHAISGPVIGSALVVRAGSEISSLSQLKKRRLGAVSPLAFGGFQIYWGEMAVAGLQPKDHFSEILFSQFPVDALVYWLRDNQVNAAVLPACLLETMSEEGLINFSDYRVLNQKFVDGYQCLTSSQLYPNWSFSKLKATSSTIAEKVAQALFEMPESDVAAVDSGSLGWTAPVSSYDIHLLYQRLDIHPWQAPWWNEVVDWLQVNWYLSLLLLLIIAGGFSHHLWVQYLVQKRTSELRSMNKQVLNQQHQIEHAQRIAILGELSSDIAHELSQPLAAINSFAEGGLIRMEQNAVTDAHNGTINQPTPHDFKKLLNKISNEAQRGGKIIERIRAFARRQPINRISSNLNQLIQETLSLLEYEISKYQVDIQLDLPVISIYSEVDPVGIQQLLVNLIRNSLEAMSEQPGERQLSIALKHLNESVIQIRVEDTGCGMNPDNFKKLFLPFYTTRAEGLGLGMPICKRIIEAHGGTIDVKNGPVVGTIVQCNLKKVSHD